MQRIVASVLLFLVSIVLYNCDIPGYIAITNDSEGIITYKYDIQEGDSIKTYVIEVKNGIKQNEAIIMFGFGQLWTNERIREYLSRVRRIEITSSKGTILLTDKEEMFTYFKKSRRGLFNNFIKIRVL